MRQLTIKRIILTTAILIAGLTARSETQPKASRRAVSSACSAACQQAKVARGKIIRLIRKYQLQPNPMNQKTFDRQTEVVQLTQREVAKLVTQHAPTSKDQIEALLLLWSAGAAYDSSYAIAINNESLLAPHYESIHAFIKEQLKKKQPLIERVHLLHIQLSLAVTESEREEGNDPK